MYVKTQCKVCDIMFEYTKEKKGGRSRVLCDRCAPLRQKERQRKADAKYRVKQGRLVGVGSGGAQRGEKNHRWKGGHSLYRQRCFGTYGEQCFHCSTVFLVVAHHIDGDRKNGSIENLRPVCWRCHQTIEHHCQESLLNLSEKSKKIAESKRVRDSKGKYCRIKTAEKTGEASR